MFGFEVTRIERDCGSNVRTKELSLRARWSFFLKMERRGSSCVLYKGMRAIVVRSRFSGPPVRLLLGNERAPSDWDRSESRRSKQTHLPNPLGNRSNDTVRLSLEPKAGLRRQSLIDFSILGDESSGIIGLSSIEDRR